ncbi:hypothetical protein AB0I81_59065 [Nonomuraea sp. NPDC050404]|uniref:hypothetical protein n=1 Tax=Nonomuraea sp. NPDC050404 TaxID=3155783 RepID=UPI0033D40BD2
MTDFTGVRQPEFDAMATKHTEAATRLAELAASLHDELSGAGLDTLPAARLRQLAGRITDQAQDLRRRQKLLHELQRRQVTFGGCTPTGGYLELPDSLEAAQGLLDGTLAGRAALRAADGDAKAVAELEKYASRAGQPDFVRTFLGLLGPAGLTRLPGSLARQIRDARTRQDTAAVTQLSRQGKSILRMLSTALATGTDRRSPAYQGPDFLTDLTKQGRAEHKAGSVTYAGYQAQALIWRAHDGRPPYSKEFMETVGRDVIVYEQEQRKNSWTLNTAYGTRHLPITDLATALGLGTLLHPGTHANPPDAKHQTAMVDNLLHAATFSRDASHALLHHTPPGWKESILDYLLTTRWGAANHLDDHKPLRDLLVTATTGQDPTSAKLAADLTKILSDQVRGAFGMSPDGNLELRNRDLFDLYTPLAYPLGRAISAHIDQLSQLLLNHEKFGDATAEHLSYALTLATADDTTFENLIAAQTEHMRAALDTVPPVGLNAANAELFGFSKADVKQYDLNQNGLVDKDDLLHFLEDRSVEEGEAFGQLVEIRRQVLIAQGLDDKKADEALKTMVSNAVGLLPVPGAKQVSELARGAFGEMLGKDYEKLAGVAYDEIAKQVGQRMGNHGRTMDDTHETLAGNRLAVDRLGEQLLATALLNKGALDQAPREGEIFTTGTPPAIKPFTAMNSREYSAFLRWARAKGGSSSLLDRFAGASRETSKVNDYLGLRIPSASSGVEK